MGKGTQTDTYTEDIDEWVKANPTMPNAALLQKANAAIDRILSENSELVELWEESDEAEAWRASIAQLKAAVSA